MSASASSNPSASRASAASTAMATWRLRCAAALAVTSAWRSAARSNARPARSARARLRLSFAIQRLRQLCGFVVAVVDASVAVAEGRGARGGALLSPPSPFGGGDEILRQTQPRRDANAFDFPDDPHNSRYVGRSVTGSNSTAAFAAPGIAGRPEASSPSASAFTSS